MEALRTPIGSLVWSGTETAQIWQTYMDGAVRSGHRAALEALSGLASQAQEACV
jgi:monoamine oxidase